MKMIVYSIGMTSMSGQPEEVDGEDVGFHVHGKKFIVHRTPTFGKPVVSKHKWTVTETSTGFSICRGVTKKGATERAREILRRVSAEKMEAACANAKKALSEALSEAKAREAG